MKSKIMNILRLLAFTTLTLLSAVHGQSPAESKVSLKIDLVSWGEDIPGLTIKKEEVSALAFRYSKTIRYSGSQVLEISQTPGAKLPELEMSAEEKELMKKLPAPVEPAVKPVDPAEIPPEILARRKENPNLVALAMIPANSTRVTVLLAPGKGGTFQTYVIDDDPTKLPFGKLRIHNYSAIPIALRCNGTELKELKTREAMYVSPVQEQVIYELAYKKDNEWQIQENNLLPINADEQSQMIILQSDANFFTSGDGSRGGYLQTVVLKRRKEVEPVATP